MTDQLYLTLFAITGMPKPKPGLEDRLKAFLESSPMTENLDEGDFPKIFGAAEKADYLLGKRTLVAELKTLNGDPKDRVERQLRERMARPGAPIAFGRVGINQVVGALDDADAVNKAMVDLSTRAVRRHLQKSNVQIASTKEHLAIPDAVGLTVLINENEPMIDAPAIGYSIKATIEAVSGGYPNIRYILAVIESHRIRLPDGTQGYPLIFVSRQFPNDMPIAEGQVLGMLLTGWADVNGGTLVQIPHGGSWDTFAPVYDDGPPVLSIY